MKNRIAVALFGVAFVAAGPAFAQFASGGGGASSGGPNISGAGTGLSAPSSIGAGSPGTSNPNAIASPSAAPSPVIAPTQPIYPGVGIGGAGLPPAAVMPQTTRRSTGTASGGH